MRRIRKDDRVRVITGKDRGKTGRVVKVYPHDDRVLVEGINMVTKHEPLRAGGAARPQEGGIIQTEARIHISNVQPICPQCEEPVRVGYQLLEEDDRTSKMRVCKRCDGVF
jgi:large subunit ribosomal protein L24